VSAVSALAGRTVIDSLADLAARGGDAARATMLSALRKTETWAQAQLLPHQLGRIGRVLEHARRTVPFYAELDPGAAASMERFRELPLLTRSDVRDRREELLSRVPPPGHAVVRQARSSGSTGRHVTVAVDGVSATVIDVLALRDHAWHDRDLRQKGGAIRAFPAGADAPHGGKAARWAAHPDSGPACLLDIHTPVAAQLDWLLRERPAYLATYASNAAALVTLAGQRGMQLPGLRELGTFGEVVPEGLREKCRRVLGVPLADAYSTVETGFVALECPEGGRYHTQGEHLLVEVLRDDGTACEPGATGRLVVTTLHALAMPLIRYELGDHAVLADACPCGRGSVVLERILGRSRNMLRLPGGDVLWPRYGSTLIGEEFPLRQFRLVQTSLTELVLEVALTRPFEGDEEVRLRRQVLGIVRYPFELELREVAEIPRHPGGKFEDFVCEVGDREV